MNVRILPIAKNWALALTAMCLCACATPMIDNPTPKVAANKVAADKVTIKKAAGAPVYKKEVIISTGYANISSQKSNNEAQQRLMAIRASKLDAYRNLTEQIYGQQLNSSTSVEDMIISSDTIRAHVEGLVYGAKVVSISPIGDDSYETKLQLELNTMLELRRIYLAAR